MPSTVVVWSPEVDQVSDRVLGAEADVLPREPLDSDDQPSPEAGGRGFQLGIGIKRVAAVPSVEVLPLTNRICAPTYAFTGPVVAMVYSTPGEIVKLVLVASRLTVTGLRGSARRDSWWWRCSC